LINFSTSAAGSISIELQDPSGIPIPGFSLQDMEPIFGDSLDRIVRWMDKTDVSSLSGKSIRMRCRLRDADMFAFRFK
jgi:hypothetical protein